MPITAPNALRPIQLDLAPVEVAAALRHLPGLVFFDSAMEHASYGRLSIVAARPESVVRDWPTLAAEVRARANTTDADDGLPRGFAAGVAGYDGEVEFGLYEQALFFRHDRQQWLSLGALERELRPSPLRTAARPVFRPQIEREKYEDMVRAAQEYIAAGDIYQVNLAHRFDAEWDGEPWALYESLRHYSPAPFAAFLALENGRALLSASPELFLKMSGSSIRTRPIKGTRARHVGDPDADTRAAWELRTSPKEQAELVMITDLERNDLGQVCEYGSVAVRGLLALERYEQVFHLVSTVEGRLRPGVDHVAALRACFPGGSITGAPKKRAREIIADLEPVPRGLYTGALGWLGFGGESQFNIIIRTICAEPGRLNFHVGAGIVADSNPAREWQETLDKAAGMLLAAERMTTR